MHRWGFAPLQFKVWEQIFPSCITPNICMSRVSGAPGRLRVVDQTQPLAGPSHLPAGPVARGSCWLMGQTLELTGGLRGTLLQSLGQQEGCTQRFLMHQITPNLLFHAAKGGFLPQLLWRRGTACSAHLHHVVSPPRVPGSPPQLAHLHQFPPTVLVLAPAASGHVSLQMSTGHGGRLGWGDSSWAPHAYQGPDSFPRAAPSLAAPTWRGHTRCSVTPPEPLSLPAGERDLSWGAEEGGCGNGLMAPLSSW